MIFRGAVYAVKAPPGAQGHEQRGPRYGVIIQSDRFGSSTVTIALTSTHAGSAVYRPEVVINGTKTRILTDQIFSVASGRLGAFHGSLEPHELTDLDRALMLRLGLI